MRRRLMLKSSAGVSPVLPAEYQQVEWIGKVNTDYNHNPYLVINYALRRNDIVSAKVHQSSVSSAEEDFIGTQPQWSIYYANGAIIAWNCNLISLNYGNTYDTVVTQMQDITSATFNVGIYKPEAYYFSGEIYHISVERGGELAVNLVPCYRKSDGVIGMYDTVTNTFYTNAGTGTFTKGADVN